MSQFIFKLLQFLFFSLLIYVVLVIVLASLEIPSCLKMNMAYSIGMYDHQYTRMKEVKSFSDIDLLIVGSSQAYRGFDTRIFNRTGYSSFNLGSSNQTPLQSEILLKRYLDKLNPKTVIYAVYPESFSVDGIESTLHLISNDKIDLDIVKLGTQQLNLKIFNTLIYAEYRQLFNLLIGA